ncbi:MAG: type IV pilus modification protein PilV [Sphingomonadaceae bacterium]
MLEVLVAVVVLALGIVAGVAMQLAALRAHHQTALLSQASQLAANLAERMRANPLPAADNPYLSLNYDALAEPDPVPPQPLCYAPGPACGSAQLAHFDLYEVKTLVRDRLPGGRVLVCRDAAMWQGGQLRWACTGNAAAPLVVKVGWRTRQPDGTPVRDQAGTTAPGVALAVGAAL